MVVVKLPGLEIFMESIRMDFSLLSSGVVQYIMYILDSNKEVMVLMEKQMN